MNKATHLTSRQKREWEDWLLTCRRLEETTKPSINETPTQQKKRIRQLLRPNNFDAFVDYYFKSEDFKPAPFGWFHWDAIRNVFVNKHRKHIWEWHRESAKSVFADIFVPIHKLATGDLTGMILAGESEDKAKNLIKDVEAQLRHNQKLINDFGNFGITGSWLSGFFQTSKGIGFWAFGLGQNPAGVRNAFKRPNLGIVDDADNKDKAKNQKLTKERVDWIKGEFMGCLAKDDRCFIYVNNRVHKEGITAHIVGNVEEDDLKDDSFAHIQACLTEHPITHKPIYPDGLTEAEILADLKEKGAVPAWKEYYSLEDCAAKVSDYGLRNALRQLYHKHIEEGNLFTDENMPWAVPYQLEQYDALVTYCDPAFGESGKGCYKCIALVGKKKHTYDILWVWLRQKGNWVAAHRYIAEEIGTIPQVPCSKHLLGKIKGQIRHWVEANELQRTELRKTYQIENLNHRIPWYPRYDRDKKPEKIGRIENLEPIANHGHLRFNSNFKGNKDMMKLREHFKSFPNGFIDGADTVQGAKTKLDKMVIQRSKKVRTGKYNKYNSRW